MKVTEIKKLKVSELRSRLKEMGLDTRGLKAELVDRLWSALESQPTPSEGAEESKGQHDTSTTRLTPTESPVPSASPPSPAAVPPLSDPDLGRHYSDSATQTDPGSGSTTPEPQTEPVIERVCSVEGGEADAGEHRGRAFYEFKEEIRYKRAKSPQPPLEREDVGQEHTDSVRLDPYGGHLHFEVGQDGACGQPRFWDRFPSLWSGCRLTHGVLQGKVGFEVRLERKLSSTKMEFQEEPEAYGMRIGWSVASTSLLLGEEELSYAYDHHGKKVTDGKEEDFGEPFSEGDIIGCYASLSIGDDIQLSFRRNGRFMGAAFSLDMSVLQGRALFPHVLCKNCSIRFLLDPTAPPWYPSPIGFTPLVALPAGQRVRAGFAPTSRSQCEMVLLVGLPGSGKSHWARTHLQQQHPKKHYVLLGTEELLTCMLRGGQRDNKLRQASQCLTELIKVAADFPRNYILDQCNILFSAQRYKLQLFSGFRRRVVVVFPSAEEWKRRLYEHRTKDGEQIPETALLKLQVSFSLPEQHSELLEELQYVELPQEMVQNLLQEYKDGARRLLPPVPKQEKKTRAHNLRAKQWIRWSRLRGWRDTRPNAPTWIQQPRYWNVAYEDRGFYGNGHFVYNTYHGS